MRGARASSSPPTAPPISLDRLSPALEDTDQECPPHDLSTRALGTDSGLLLAGPVGLCSHLGRGSQNPNQEL